MRSPKPLSQGEPSSSDSSCGSSPTARNAPVPFHGVSTDEWENEMKATALIAAAALAFGTAAFAQQDQSVRGEENHRVDQQDHGSANQKMRSGAHRLAEKTRHAFHRMGDKMHHVASRDRERHENDTRAMGGPGTGRSSRDAESARQARMDDAYGRWHAQHDKTNR